MPLELARTFLTFPLKPKPLHWISPKTCSSFTIISYPTPSHLLFVPNSSSSSQPQPEDGGSGIKNALSDILDERVEELLAREENKELLDNLNKASLRVELAKKQLADIQNQQLQAQHLQLYINQLESKASQIAECQQEVMEARAMVEEAERYLSETNTDSNTINRDEERWESIKAGAIAALVGTVAAVPVYNLNTTPTPLPQLLLQLGITFATCALFGLTFRYAVRRDLDNIQLKTGTCAAFAFVKGLATLDGGSPLEPNSESILTHALNGAFFVSQDLFIFFFAAVSLDFCFKTRILSPFPISQHQIEGNKQE